jgi:hypothetical protein
MAPAILTAPVSDLVSPEVAAQFLGVTIGTLAVWRCTRRYGIPYCKIGKSVKYRLRDLEAFAQSRTVGAGAE